MQMLGGRQGGSAGDWGASQDAPQAAPAGGSMPQDDFDDDVPF